MIEPYLIRSRWFLALGVPGSLCPILHAWAIVENRAFCHELMATFLHLDASDKGNRIAIARKLDALAQFSKTTGHDLGKITRKPITVYGSFNLNLCVSFIQEQLAAKSDVGNVFVEIDALASEAISRFLPRLPATTKKRETQKQGKAKHTHTNSNTLGLNYEALISRPYCMVVHALRLAKMGFYVFPVHTTIRNGICSCRWGRHCRKAGKHPCTAHWQQRASRFEDAIIQMWTEFPDANVGIACGRRLPNGQFLTVLDCDWRHLGHVSIKHLEKNELCALPITLEVNSGGGPHRYFSHPRAFHSGKCLGGGIDLQSKGRFVVAAGMHVRGTSYELTDRPIARLPDEWASYADAAAQKTLPMIDHGFRTNKLLSWAGGLIASGANPEFALATLRQYRDSRIVDPQDFDEMRLAEMVGYCDKKERRKVQRKAA